MEQQRPSKFVPGLQSEPFYDLLQPSGSVQSSPVQFSSVQTGSTFSSGSSSTGGGFPDLKVSNEPSFDFQPLRPSKGKFNGEDSHNNAWQEESRNDSGNGKSSAPLNMSLGLSLDSHGTDGQGKNQSPLRNVSRDPPGGRSLTPDDPWHLENPGSYGQQYSELSGPKHDELKTKTVDHATVNAVEQTMKKYADNLLRVLEDMTGRLQHLETTTSRLENVVSDIQVAVGNSHGDVSGRLRSLDNIIREVQRGVQNLRDKQEIAETQAELAKMQVTSVPPPPPPPPIMVPDTNTPHTLPLPPAPASQAPSAPPQTEPPLPSSAPSAPVLSSASMESPPPYLPALPPPPPALPPPPNPHQQQGPQMQQQQSIPLPQMQQQNVSQTTSVPHGMQISSYGQPIANPTPHYSQEAPHYPQEPPHYPQEPPHYMPHNQGLPPPPPPPPPPPTSTTTPQPQFSNAPQNNPPQSQMPFPSQVPQTEGPQSFMGGYGGPQRGAPPSVPIPQQGQPGQQPSQGGGGQFQSPPPTMYDSYNFPGRGSYPPPPPPPQSHPTPSMYESPSIPSSYGNPPSYRVAQPVPSVPSSGGGGGGGGGYPRLQLAQPVSHSSAPPPNSSSSGPPNSGPGPLNASRVPIDKVIEDVAAMGFTKDQVRAVVRKLTENGQSVDLNVVLDKLMNPESGQKGWFGR